jgi:putative nucleotidyltransferase with HDIG domain
MNIVDQILQSATELPPFPAVIQRALQLIEDPRSSARDVVDVIQYDQSITAEVLKLCNSAYFGLRRTVHSLREALVMIGFNQLLEIVLSRESAPLLYEPCKGYDLEYGELWRHSVACGLLSRIISPRLNREPTPAHFTAALLHDIGKMILSKFAKDYFEEIKRQVQDRHLSFIEAEKEVIGIDHAELGGKITEQWEFPKSIVSAVRYHHTPFLAPEDQGVVELIYLCDLVAMLTGIGGGADGLSYRGYEEVIKRYNVKEEDIERFIVQLDDRFHQVKGILKMEPRGQDRSIG